MSVRNNKLLGFEDTPADLPSLRSLHNSGQICPCFTEAWTFREKEKDPIIPLFFYIFEVGDWALKLFWLGLPVLPFLIYCYISGAKDVIRHPLHAIAMCIMFFLSTSTLSTMWITARMENPFFKYTYTSKYFRRWSSYGVALTSWLKIAFPQPNQSINWNLALKTICYKEACQQRTEARLLFIANLIVKYENIRSGKNQTRHRDLLYSLRRKFRSFYKISEFFFLVKHPEEWYFTHAISSRVIS